MSTTMYFNWFPNR